MQYCRFTSGMWRPFTMLAPCGGSSASISRMSEGATPCSVTREDMASAAACMGEPTEYFLMFVSVIS